MTLLVDMREVVLPEPLYVQLVHHARRKLAGEHVADEEPAPKAYGLVGGRVRDGHAEVTHVVPLRRNLRGEAHVKAMMDQVMDQLAIRSETPLDRRGWVSDPRELQAAEELFDGVGSVLLGGYHMHRVAWDHDPLRDTCTEVDAELGSGSGLWMFILSMVDPSAPILRAFFEGDNHQEVAVRVATRLACPKGQQAQRRVFRDQ